MNIKIKGEVFILWRAVYIWIRNWSGIVPFFAFPKEIRKVIYTTNTIESVNRQIRKIIKNKGVFPDDGSVRFFV
ncbi:hypothetical protein BA173_05700 [Rickettsia sp. MEAM1 (Bemisia tabaci)]|nr:hypothetical protein BA173_05700 [Rickettsia sp. MEAM1 (Bemisia tabaci)]